MKEHINKYGSVILSSIKLGQIHKQSKTTDDLIFYGYYEYTGLKKFWTKVRMGVKLKINEYYCRRKH